MRPRNRHGQQQKQKQAAHHGGWWEERANECVMRTTNRERKNRCTEEDAPPFIRDPRHKFSHAGTHEYAPTLHAAPVSHAGCVPLSSSVPDLDCCCSCILRSCCACVASGSRSCQHKPTRTIRRPAREPAPEREIGWRGGELESGPRMESRRCVHLCVNVLGKVQQYKAKQTKTTRDRRFGACRRVSLRRRCSLLRRCSDGSARSRRSRAATTVADGALTSSTLISDCPIE